MLPRGSLVFVTGGTGFLGGAFLQQLAGRYRVVALARQPDAAPLIDGVEWIGGDLLQPLARIRLPRQIAAVVHLASLRDPVDGGGAEQLFTINAGSTAALLEYAVGAGARRFVYGSTGGIYGYRSGRIRESHPPAPFDLYTLSKWHGETVVARERRLSSAVVRYFFPYGPGQRAGIVPRLTSTIQAGRAVTLYRRGHVPHINPVFVDDAADLTHRALAASARLIVNCAGTDVVTVRELSNRIAPVLGMRATFVAGRDPSVGDMVASLSQAARTLGFKPRVSLDAGLARTLRVTS